MARIPQIPPDFTLDQSTAERLLPRLFDPAIPDNYLHWDQLRFREPPAGLSSQDWWGICKIRRGAQQRPLPLRSTTNNFFAFQIPPQLHELLFRITMEGGSSIIAPEAVNTPAERERHRTTQLIEEAIASSLIEGAVTTRAAAQKLLRDKRPPRDKSEQMITNNYRTMQRLREVKNQLLTPALVFEIHRLLTEKTLDFPEDAGKFRKEEDKIVISDMDGTIYHRPPIANELPARLEALCAFANGETPAEFVHPVVRSILLHFWLAYDHPFVDGNGRTARALFYWSMLHQGFWITEFLSISRIIYKSRRAYYDAFLFTETDANDATYFLIHQANVLSETIDTLRKHMSRRAKKIEEIDSRIQRITGLNLRQKSLLEHALRNLNHRYTFAEHQQNHGVAYATARADLLDLAKHEFLIQSKEGKALVFRPAPDLDALLAS